MGHSSSYKKIQSEAQKGSLGHLDLNRDILAPLDNVKKGLLKQKKRWADWVNKEFLEKAKDTLGENKVLQFIKIAYEKKEDEGLKRFGGELRKEFGRKEYEKIEKELNYNDKSISSRIENIIGKNYLRQLEQEREKLDENKRLDWFNGELLKGLGKKEYERIMKKLNHEAAIQCSDEIENELKKEAFLGQRKFQQLNQHIAKINSIEKQEFVKEGIYALLTVQASKDVIQQMGPDELRSFADIIHLCSNIKEDLSEHELKELYEKKVSYHKDKNKGAMDQVSSMVEQMIGIDPKNLKESIKKKLNFGSDNKDKIPQSDDKLINDFATSPLTIFSLLFSFCVMGLSGFAAAIFPAVGVAFAAYKVRGLMLSDEGKEGTMHNPFTTDNPARMITAEDGKVNYQELVKARTDDWSTTVENEKNDQNSSVAKGV